MRETRATKIVTTARPFFINTPHRRYVCIKFFTSPNAAINTYFNSVQQKERSEWQAFYPTDGPHRSTLRPPLRRGGRGATKKRREEDVEDVMQAINAACRGGERGRRSPAISSELVWIYRLLTVPPFLYGISGSFMCLPCSRRVWRCRGKTRCTPSSRPAPPPVLMASFYKVSPTEAALCGGN